MADFTPPGGGSNLDPLEVRLARIKGLVAELESRLQKDVAAERKGAAPGRRATERAVRDDLTPESQRAKVQDTKATESDTAAIEENTRARRTRLNTLQEDINRTRRATRLQEPVTPSVAAQQSTLLPRAANAEKEAKAVEQQVRARALLASVDARQVSEEQATNSALSAGIQKRELASQALRKHGALTTEFISAAARGNVTLREMGFQVGATIGKFAGWTAAAGATYGALAAITQLGKGALDSASNVQILSNYITDGFNTDKAREQLRSLAQQFNLPVAQVGEAFQGMGKIFHNQDQAFAATKAALYGVKVGELSAADSTKYLTAVVNGFHLEGTQLVDVLDKVNQAQNRFGTATKDTLAGAAQAAGAWKAAGGDWQQLVNLIVTGEKVTGRSGVNIGTALQRSAEIIKRSPKNQAGLKAFGIDPNQDIGRIYDEAFKKVRSGQVKGADVNKLATALSTGQLSSRISPILQNYQLYNKVVSDTSPENSKNSAQKELENRLKSVSERAKAVGVNLQAIGVELARSGAFDVLGLALIVLNKMLTITGDLVHDFNDLPKGIREALVIATEFYGVLRLIRRFNKPGLNAETGQVTNTGFLKQNSDTFQRRTLQEAARNQVKFYQDEQERLAHSLPTQQLAHDTAVRTRGAVADETRAGIAAGDEAAHRKLQAAVTAEANIAARVAETEAQLAAVEERLVLTREAEIAVSTSNLRKAKREGLTATQVARREGIYYQPGTSGRPTPDRPVPVAGGEPVPVPIGQGRPLGTDEARALAKKEKEVADAQGRLAKAGGAVESGFGRLKGGFLSLGESLRGLASAGNLLMFGVFGAITVGDLLKQWFDDVGKKADQVGAGPQTKAEGDKARNAPKINHGYYLDQVPPSARAQYEAAQAQTAEGRNSATAQTWYDLQQDVITGRKPWQAFLPSAHRTPYTQARDLWTNAPPLSTGLGGDPFGKNFPAPWAKGAPNKLGIFGSAPPTATDKPLPGLFVDEIVGDAQTVVKLYHKGRASKQMAQDAIHKALLEMKMSPQGDPSRIDQGTQLLKRTQAQFGGDKGNHISLLQELKGLSPKDLIAYVQENTAAIEGLGTGKKNLGAAATALKAAIAKGGAHPTGDQAKAIKAARDGVRAVLSQIDKEFQDASALAEGNAGKEDRAYKTALSKVGKTHGGSDAKREAQTILQQHLDSITKDLTDDLSLAAGDPRQIMAAYRKALARARRSGNSRQAQVIQRQIIEQQYQQDTTNIDSSSNLAAARDPAHATQIKLRAIGQKIAAAIRTFGRNSNQVQDLIAQQYDLQKQAVDDQVALINANTSVAQAQAQTPAGEAKAGMAGALKAYNAMAASGKYKPSELRAAWGQYLAAKKAFNQQLRADAQALSDSITALAVSRTEDPIKQTAAQLAGAQRTLKNAKTPTDRNNALAGVNNARRAHNQAIQQSRYDDIEYYASIGKISVDIEIQQLQSLERTIKGNKALKRQIHQRWYQLQQQANQDSTLSLNLDNIRLPTTYEIRRAVLGGGPTRQGITVHNRPTVNVTVNDPGAADAVYTAIEDTLGTTLTAARRAGR